jgi:hypothetical protein
MILRLPENILTYHLQNAIVWIDQSGIVYSRPGEGEYIVPTRETMIDELNTFKKIIGDKKVCMILESHPKAQPPKKEDRDFIAEELSKVTKAMAIVTTSAFNKMVANLFFTFKPADYPMKMFNNEPEARLWIQNYL